MTGGQHPNCPRGLYLVTPDWLDTARLENAVARALEGRPALLQYRNKLASVEIKRLQAARLLPLCRAAGVPLVINDAPEVAMELGADGVHIGRDDGDPAAVRSSIGNRMLLGVSCYDDLARARAAVAAGADYVAFGAMFGSPTKPQAPRASIDVVRQAATELPVPVATIGGITRDNAGQLVGAGAALVAVISDVFAAADPAARAAAFQDLFAPSGAQPFISDRTSQ